MPWPRQSALTFSVLLCLAAAAWSAVHPQASAPPASAEGAAQARVREFVEIFNSGQSDRVRRYVAETFSPAFLKDIPLEEHVRILSRGFEGSGGYDLQRVVPFGRSRAAGVLQDRKTKQWMRIVLTTDAVPPFRVAGIGIMPSGPVLPELPAGPVSDAQMVDVIRACLERAAAEGQFSGAVLLAKDGRAIFKAAYGLADRSFDVPNHVDTKFNLGSMNKMFTAVAVAQLAERKSLSFDDPVGKYLTDWLPAELARKITIGHLLTHTSGLGSYFNDTFMKSSRDLYRKVDDYKPLVAGEKLQFEPGTRWSYSNTGFLLLGAIIEKVTGQSYFDHVRDNVYRPAGMAATDCYEMDDVVPNLAIGYTRVTGRWKSNLFMHVIKGSPAGGGFSTVEDLLRFDVALRGHKLLGPEYTHLLLSAKPERNSLRYGYGFEVEENPRVVGHSGGFAGISSNLSMDLDGGYTLAVMSNLDAGASDVTDIFKAMLQSRLPTPEKEGTWDQAVPPPS
jgi:CubicO group peptidase (beta-lactamase class C family)